MFEVIPGILEKDWEKIAQKMEALKGLVDTVQIDVIDGKFTDSETFLDPKEALFKSIANAPMVDS